MPLRPEQRNMGAFGNMRTTEMMKGLEQLLYEGRKADCSAWRRLRRDLTDLFMFDGQE